MVIDICVITILCLFSAVGFKKGMLISLFSIFSFILAIYITYLILPYVSNVLNSIISFKNVSVSWINKENLSNFINQDSKLSILIKFLLHTNSNVLMNNALEIVVNGILFIVLSMVIRILLKALIKNIAGVLKKVFVVGTFDKMCGLLFGFLKGILISCILCFVLLSVKELNLFNNVINNQIESSTLVSVFADNTNYIIKTIGGYSG